MARWYGGCMTEYKLVVPGRVAAYLDGTGYMAESQSGMLDTSPSHTMCRKVDTAKARADGSRLVRLDLDECDALMDIAEDLQWVAQSSGHLDSGERGDLAAARACVRRIRKALDNV